MLRARSMIFTGSPMSRTKISPRPPIEPAWTTSETASGVVMKKRVISGCVIDRAALGDLPLEDADHAPGGVEHVAEAHGHEPRGDVVTLAVGLHDPLAERSTGRRRPAR